MHVDRKVKWLAYAGITLVGIGIFILISFGIIRPMLQRATMSDEQKNAQIESFYKGDPKKISGMEWIINIEEGLKKQNYEPNITPAFVID